MLSIALIFTVLLDVEKNNKPVNWGCHIYTNTHVIYWWLTGEDAVRYLNEPGLQTVFLDQ